MKQMCRILVAVCVGLLIAISPLFVISPVTCAEGETAIGAETGSASVLVTAVIKAPDDPDNPDNPDNPDDPDDPDNPDDPDDPDGDPDPNPAKTGDPSPIDLYVKLLILSSAGIVLCIYKLKR